MNMNNILPGPRTVAIAGLGSRGYNTYAQCAKLFPEKMKLVAGADIRRDRLEMAKEHYHIPEEMSWMVEEFLDIVSRRIEPTVRTTALKDSVESHFVALAAERSRVEGGRSVRLSELI